MQPPSAAGQAELKHKARWPGRSTYRVMSLPEHAQGLVALVPRYTVEPGRPTSERPAASDG